MDSSAALSAAPAPEGAPGLTPLQLAVLQFERQWWQHQGAKEQAVRTEFGWSTTRYYQVLNALLDKPEALESDPMLVRRLLRLRSERAKARTARALGVQR